MNDDKINQLKSILETEREINLIEHSSKLIGSAYDRVYTKLNHDSIVYVEKPNFQSELVLSNSLENYTEHINIYDITSFTYKNNILTIRYKVTNWTGFENVVNSFILKFEIID